MRPTSATLGTGPVVLLASLALALLSTAAAFAADGESTPGATVTVMNPPDAGAGRDLSIALTAHSEKRAVENPSCRPEDLTLACWGSLRLQIPDAGGLSVRGFEVHRVAVGGAGCGDDEDGSCGDHDDAAAATVPDAWAPAVQATVSGVAELVDPGDTGESPGAKVQIKLLLTDNSSRLYTDQLTVQVNRFVPGPAKPLLYASELETVQQVKIHLRG